MSEKPRKLTRSYIHVPRTTPFSGMPIGQSFNAMADKNPDKEMYVFYADQERMTYRQMQEESHQFAGALVKLGLKKGDTLGVWGGNHYEWLLAYLAAIQIGMITIHMRIDFPFEIHQQLLKKLVIKVLVLMRSPSDLCDKACNIIPELLSNTADSLECQSTPMLKYVINAGNQKVNGAYSLTEFMAIGKEVDRSLLIDACRKGSTGLPKGVTHTHKSLSIFLDELSSFSEDANGNKVKWDSRYAMIMSFSGVGAQLGALLPIFTSVTTIIVSPTYDKDKMVSAIQDERVTGMWLLIHHLNDILHLPNLADYDLSSLEICVSGWSIIPHSLWNKAKRIAKYTVLGYGGTEGFSAMQSPKDSSKILDSQAYYPIQGSEVKVIGEDEQILPINTPGEICFRSSMLFRYYWGDKEKTKAAKRPSGWYHTGDLGMLDENGYLRIVGRKTELIIKEGVNLAPGDLEVVLCQHPSVRNVMVVGVPDERTSEEVCAYVRLSPSSMVTQEELQEFCTGKISHYLVPKYIIFTEDAFPVTETGKFDRRKIAEQAKSILGL